MISQHQATPHIAKSECTLPPFPRPDMFMREVGWFGEVARGGSSMRSRGQMQAGGCGRGWNERSVRSEAAYMRHVCGASRA